MQSKVTVDGNALTAGIGSLCARHGKGTKAGVEPVSQIGSDGKYTLYTQQGQAPRRLVQGRC